MEQYCCQMQKPNYEAEQRGDVWIDEERIGRKKGERERGVKGEREGEDR